MTISYHDYSLISEALDSFPKEVKRDEGLEQMAKFSVPSNISDSLKVLYTDDMEKNNLRLIKLQNHDGDIEYHLHNTSMMAGKSTNSSKRGFLDALNIIHHDATNELGNGKKVVLQTFAGNENFPKYKMLAQRIATRAGKTLRDGGMKPLTSNPFIKGPTIIIE